MINNNSENYILRNRIFEFDFDEYKNRFSFNKLCDNIKHNIGIKYIKCFQKCINIKHKNIFFFYGKFVNK